MNLAEALEKEARARVVRVPCTVSVILRQLTEDERADLKAAFASEMSHAAIARALKTIGRVASQGVIARHRNGDCSCDAR